MADEGLSIAMEEDTSQCIFKGVSLPNNEPIVSYFQYADDAIFLGEWSTPNAKNFIGVLPRSFQGVSHVGDSPRRVSSSLVVRMKACLPV